MLGLLIGALRVIHISGSLSFEGALVFTTFSFIFYRLYVKDFVKLKKDLAVCLKVILNGFKGICRGLFCTPWLRILLKLFIFFISMKMANYVECCWCFAVSTLSSVLPANPQIQYLIVSC